MALDWTDVYYIKLSWPKSWDFMDIMNGAHPPLRAKKTGAGWEFAVNFQTGWLKENGLTLPLAASHMGHIPIATDPLTDLFHQR